MTGYLHTNTRILSTSLYCAGMDEIKLLLSFLACWGNGAQSLDDVGLHVFSLKGVPVHLP